jgi:glycerophosphoryl diester phosphodiesterase
LKDHGVVGIGTVSKYLTKEYVDDAHRRGIKIYTYAVDCEAETLRKCVELDVDAILLDYPDTLDKVLLQK